MGHKTTTSLSLACACLWALCGCTKPPPKMPETVAFTGVVKLDGKPMDRGLITLIPKDKGLNAIGAVDAEGKFKVKSYSGKQEKDGAVPGEYTVTISRFVLPNGSPQDLSKPVEIPGRESLPVKYSSPNFTELKATVPQTGGTKDFEIKSK